MITHTVAQLIVVSWISQEIFPMNKKVITKQKKRRVKTTHEIVTNL